MRADGQRPTPRHLWGPGSWIYSGGRTALEEELDDLLGLGADDAVEEHAA
jgi:hypothetical protein